MNKLKTSIMKVDSFFVYTIGDGLDYISTIKDIKGNTLQTISWGMTEGWVLSENSVRNLIRNWK